MDKLMVDYSIGFAMCAHRNQKRKYTEAPYWTHPIAVSNLVGKYTGDHEMMVAAALHDVLEDTDVTADEMRLVFGDRITRLVLEVTDVSKPEDGNRERRKQIDREHLANSSVGGATIKLADLIDNTASIVKYDKGFAQIYLKEKALVLPLLTHGFEELWELADETLKAAQEALHE